MFQGHFYERVQDKAHHTLISNGSGTHRLDTLLSYGNHAQGYKVRSTIDFVENIISWHILSPHRTIWYHIYSIELENYDENYYCTLSCESQLIEIQILQD